MILELLQVLERPPCDLILEMLPVALDGIEFGRVGGQEDESDIAGNDQVPGHVKRPPVHDHDVCRAWVLLAEGVDEDLEGLCVERRQLQEEIVSGGWFDRPEQVVVLERHLLSHFRFHSPGCNPAALHTVKPETALILKEEAEPLRAAPFPKVDSQDIGEFFLNRRERASSFLSWIFRGTFSFERRR